MTGAIQLVGVDLPQLACKTLPAFDPSDWKSVAIAFRDATPITMRQAWQKELDPKFKPATIRTGKRGNALWIYAQIEDVSIINPTIRLNEIRNIPPDLKPGKWFNSPSTMCGDVFEIFLRKSTKKPYVELHITPQNQVLQLHWASRQDYNDAHTNDPREAERQIKKRLIPPPKAFVSYTRLDEKNQTWCVLAEISSRLLDETSKITADEIWCFSFCRYDMTKGNDVPIVSSTSPHPKCDFHRQEEWGHLHFSETDMQIQPTAK